VDRDANGSCQIHTLSRTHPPAIRKVTGGSSGFVDFKCSATSFSRSHIWASLLERTTFISNPVDFATPYVAGSMVFAELMVRLLLNSTW
jgi:hypothetical protein